jgi:hypothetical protein
MNSDLKKVLLTMFMFLLVFIPFVHVLILIEKNTPPAKNTESNCNCICHMEQK